MDFGKKYFEGSVHLVDLEKRPDYHRIFEVDPEPKRILSELEVLLNTRIVPGKDLLFLQEGLRVAMLCPGDAQGACGDTSRFAVGCLSIGA